MWFKLFRKQKQSHLIQEVMTRVGCEYKSILVKDVDEIRQNYHQERLAGKQGGYFPLIIVPSAGMIEIVDPEVKVEAGNSDRLTILQKAENVDVKELLQQRWNDSISTDVEDHTEMMGDFTEGEAPLLFDWLETIKNETIIMAKIPTNKPWEAAAWVPMGGFNECPLPEEQVAIFHFWYEQYGAVPALVTTDMWEFWVENPPHSREEAQALALEQFSFCDDIVWQGVGTVGALAGILLHAKSWFFWWD